MALGCGVPTAQDSVLHEPLPAISQPATAACLTSKGYKVMVYPSVVGFKFLITNYQLKQFGRQLNRAK